MKIIKKLISIIVLLSALLVIFMYIVSKAQENMSKDRYMKIYKDGMISNLCSDEYLLKLEDCFVFNYTICESIVTNKYLQCRNEHELLLPKVSNSKNASKISFALNKISKCIGERSISEINHDKNHDQKLCIVKKVVKLKEISG